MTESERIERLNAVLSGTGATVNDAFGIWALNSQLSDEHISQLAGWADLQYLVADSTRITDASVKTICSFVRLTELSIGGNAITSEAIATNTLPTTLQNLGLSSIPLADDAIESISRCHEITVLNVNYCQLSNDSLFRLAQLPKLQAMEALGAGSTPETSKIVSQDHPHVLFRLRDGLWQDGTCCRPPFPNERT